MHLSPALRQRLGRARLIAAGTVATSGVGERRSNQRGEGIEFEEHRPYQPGDDARRIDPNLYARHGSAYVREYNVGRQLTVTLLLDASRSMTFGTPSKLEALHGLASGLATVALASSDAVQVGVWQAGRLDWHERRSGLTRLDDMERNWAKLRGEGNSDIAAAVRQARDQLPPRGYTVLISDLWSDHAGAAIDTLAAAQQSLLIVQLLSPEEVHPERYTGGAVRMVDAETSDEVDITLGAAQIDRYRRLLGEWTDDVRQRVHAVGGRFVRVISDDSADEVFMRRLPGLGVLR